jgi:LacI family transcriptional regulator
VPGEIAVVVGYDNRNVTAPATRPPLITSDMNLAEIGRISALRLRGAIDAEAVPGVHVVESNLVGRESARPARRGPNDPVRIRTPNPLRRVSAR